MLLISGVPGMLLFGLIEYLTGMMPLDVALYFRRNNGTLRRCDGLYSLLAWIVPCEKGSAR